MSGHGEREQEVLEGLDRLFRLDTEREQRLSLLDTHAVLRALADRIRHEHGFDIALAGLVEDRDLVLRIWAGTQFDALHDLPIPLGLGVGGRVAAVGRPVVVGDYCRSDRITHDFDSQVSRERVTGMLEEQIRVQLRHLDPAHHFGFLLVDGVHAAEEQVNDMLGNAAPLLDFVGGSAGDDFALHATWVAVGRDVSYDGVALMVCRSAVPFRIVKTCSFTPAGTVLRVTSATPALRTVHAFDGRPAAQAYADAVGVPVESLEVDVFMEHPVGLMLDGQPWIRTPQAATPDGGLRFWAQILPGMEVDLMRSGNLLADTRTALRRTRLDLGGASGAVLFNCGFRRLEMDAKNLSAAFSSALDGIPTAGFHTYGESWLGHVNQTLTGVVFGPMSP
ncbi:FIST C-terminal domain-containing protein [Streptomyces sp. NPDC002346]